MTAAWPTFGPAAAAMAAVAIGALVRTRVTRSMNRPALSALPPPHRGWLRSSGGHRIAGVVVAVVVGVAAGPLALGFIVAVTLLVRHLEPLHAARRRRATIERSLPEAMELLVLCVRAGLTPFQAVCDLAGFEEPAVGHAFSEVERRTQRGQPFADALAALPELLGARAGGLADVIATSDRHGLPLGPVLDQLTTEARASRRQLDQAEARKLPVRLSFPLVACTLPSFVLLAIAPAVIAALSSLGATAW